jgi:hypothetical protein
MSKQHRGGLYFTRPEDACSNTTAETMPGSMNFPYSLGFRLAHDNSEVESWGSSEGMVDPRAYFSVSTPKDDYDWAVGFRLVWNRGLG